MVMIVSTGPDVQHQTLLTETTLFRHRLVALREIVAVLVTSSDCHQSDQHTCVAELKALDHRLNKLAQNVAEDGNINACGKFEWIDSVLVKVGAAGSAATLAIL
jgi:hypothetical protein